MIQCDSQSRDGRALACRLHSHNEILGDSISSRIITVNSSYYYNDGINNWNPRLVIGFDVHSETFGWMATTIPDRILEQLIVHLEINRTFSLKTTRRKFSQQTPMI